MVPFPRPQSHVGNGEKMKHSRKSSIDVQLCKSRPRRSTPFWKLTYDSYPTDSIDLQDPEAPSAKEHKHSPITNGGVLAPHQAETLREVAAETKEERRLSWANGDIGDLQQYAEDLSAGVNGNRMQQQDALAIAQNGGMSTSDDRDIDDDGDMDEDDMMDKISSSPSIEDGG
jgi:hypothetical protein